MARRQQQSRLTGQPQMGGPSQAAIAGANQFRPGTSMGNHSGFSHVPGNHANTSLPDGTLSNNNMQPPASTSRPGSSHPVLSAQNMQNLTPQQRQLMLMHQQQQQQRMGSVNPTQMSSPQGYGQQAHSPYQQHSPQHTSPTGFSDANSEQQQQQQNPGQLPPAGPSVPGIARSTRSPSVPITTPVKRQTSFGHDPYHQALMNSTGQHPSLQQSQSSQPALQQGQQMAQHSQSPPNQGWSGNMNMGMNPAAFQLNSNNASSGIPMYINPSALGGGGAQQPQNTGGWPPGAPQFNIAGSPSHTDPSISRHASATPGPGMGIQAVAPHFDPVSYPQWGS